MKRLLPFLLILVSIPLINAQDSVSVLLIENSNTSNDTITEHLVAKSPGDTNSTETPLTILSSGLNDTTKEQLRVHHYPDGDIIISGLTVPTEILLYSSDGVLLHSKREYTESSLLDLNEFGHGIYIVIVKGESGYRELKVPYFPD